MAPRGPVHTLAAGQAVSGRWGGWDGGCRGAARREEQDRDRGQGEVSHGAGTPGRTFASAVTRAAVQADPHAYDEACDALALRIAEALVDEGEAVASRYAGWDDRAA